MTLVYAFFFLPTKIKLIIFNTELITQFQFPIKSFQENKTKTELDSIINQYFDEEFFILFSEKV